MLTAWASHTGKKSGISKTPWLQLFPPRSALPKPRGFWVAKKPHVFFCPKLVEEMEQNLLTLVFLLYIQDEKTTPLYSNYGCFKLVFWGRCQKLGCGFKDFLCSPLFGEDNPNLTTAHILQMGGKKTPTRKDMMKNLPGRK